MARTPFTLAAAVSAVAPESAIIAVAPMTEGASGRIDAVRVTLDDGSHVVVRVAATSEAAEDLRAELRALRALTPGVRALLPFAAPEVHGEVPLGPDGAVITGFIDGYRVDPADVPSGPGIAPAIAGALAAIHALPVSWAREAGLPLRSPDHVRDEASRLVDRAEHSGRVPRALLTRWRRALMDEEMWRFEPTVILGGASSSSFFLEDRDGMPTVVGVVDWHGTAVGDPAVDLRWLASAPSAAADVFDAYVAAGDRAPDGLLRPRARFHAELEFAAWLVHGHDTGAEDVMDDAEALLSSLADTVGGDDVVVRVPSGMDDAMAVLSRMPDTAAQPADTSMHTDAYDPAELATWLPVDESGGTDDDVEAPAAIDVDETTERGDEADPDDTGALASAQSDAVDEDVITAPIVLPGAESSALFSLDESSDADEPARAARAAFQRWASSGSE